MNEDPFGAHNPEAHEPVKSQEERDLDQFTLDMRALDNNEQFKKKLAGAMEAWVNDFLDLIRQQSKNPEGGYFALRYINKDWVVIATGRPTPEFQQLQEERNAILKLGDNLEDEDLILETAMHGRHWEAFKAKGEIVARNRLRCQYAAAFWNDRSRTSTGEARSEPYTSLRNLPWSDSDDGNGETMTDDSGA